MRTALRLAGLLSALSVALAVVQSDAARAGASPGRSNAQAGLSAVSCPSAKECIAVGVFAPRRGPERTLAEHWNGSRWTIQQIPTRVGQQSHLDSISCTSANACIAVGASFPASGRPSRTLAERWNGRRWQIQLTPNQAGSPGSRLASVSCSSANACTAVGWGQRPNAGPEQTLVERWDGHKWVIQRTPKLLESSLVSVSCSATRACTAVGSAPSRPAFGERWNGKRWAIARISRPAGSVGTFAAGVSCEAADTCTLVGRYEPPSGTSQLETLAELWHVGSWTIQNTPNPSGWIDNQLSAVSCRSRNACVAVGSGIPIAQTDVDQPVAYRWNGESWVIEIPPNPAGLGYGTLEGVSCSAANACTAVGAGLGRGGSRVAGVPLVERWNGQGWTVQRTPPVGA